MARVTIKKKILIPMIGTWEWTKNDYTTPLVFHLSAADALLYLDVFQPGTKPREITFQATLEFHFSSASRSLVKCLTTSGKQAKELAQRIHEYYLTVHARFESLLYTVGKTRSMLLEDPIPFERFFSDNSLDGKVTFQIDDKPERDFEPKISSSRRAINPLFKRVQLIDAEKWRRMQEAIDAEDFPSPEIIELFRIRSKLEWRKRKIATIEAAVFAETALRNFVVRALECRGISKRKLKDLQNDLSFSILLNALLPMAIPRAKAEKMRPHINAVDLLRKIRNDVVHGNITETEIDEDKVRKGIEGTLKIVETIKTSLRS